MSGSGTTPLRHSKFFKKSPKEKKGLMTLLQSSCKDLMPVQIIPLILLKKSFKINRKYYLEIETPRFDLLS